MCGDRSELGVLMPPNSERLSLHNSGVTLQTYITPPVLPVQKTKLAQKAFTDFPASPAPFDAFQPPLHPRPPRRGALPAAQPGSVRMPRGYHRPGPRPWCVPRPIRSPRMTQEPETARPAPAPANEPGAPDPLDQPKQAAGKGIVFVATQLGATSILAVIASFMPAIAGIYLLANIGPVSEWFKGHGDAGLVVYIAGFALLSGLALLPTYAQAVLGGYAFGMIAGVPAALCGFLGGSIIAYEIGRVSSRDRIEGLLSKSPKWRAVRDALVGSRKEDDLLKSIGTVTLLRLPPNSPFALMNLLLSAIGVPRLAYVIGTCIGMTPRTAAAVAIGAGIQQALTKEAIDQAMPKWMWYAGAGVSIVIVLIIGSIANKAIERVAAGGNADKPAA